MLKRNGHVDVQSRQFSFFKDCYRVESNRSLVILTFTLISVHTSSNMPESRIVDILGFVNSFLMILFLNYTICFILVYAQLDRNVHLCAVIVVSNSIISLIYYYDIERFLHLL